MKIWVVPYCLLASEPSSVLALKDLFMDDRMNEWPHRKQGPDLFKLKIRKRKKKEWVIPQGQELRRR